jgi:hypothetical protein
MQAEFKTAEDLRPGDHVWVINWKKQEPYKLPVKGITIREKEVLVEYGAHSTIFDRDSCHNSTVFLSLEAIASLLETIAFNARQIQAEENQSSNP